MAAKLAELEARVSQIETVLRRMQKSVPPSDPRPWYDQILGTFDNDPGFDEMIRLGKEIRDTDHGIAEPRRRRRTGKRTASTSTRKGRG